MKQYLLGFIAVSMIIGFSAYKTDDNSEAQTKVVKQSKVISNHEKVVVEESLFWYPVQSNGNIDHNQLINQVKMTKSELETADLIPCDEAPGTDCIRGFSTLQVSDVSDSGVEQVEKAI